MIQMATITRLQSLVEMALIVLTLLGESMIHMPCTLHLHIDLEIPLLPSIVI